MKRVFLLATIALLLSTLFVSSAYAGTGTMKKYFTTVDTKAREYLIYQPLACKAKQCPLVIMFHGMGGTADLAASAFYNWQATSDQNGFVVAFPESLTIPPKSIFGYQYDPPASAFVSNKHWDIAPITSPFAATQDTHFTEAIINETAANYNILLSHIYATGHSYGGFFAYNVAMVLKDKIVAFSAGNAGMAKYFGFSWPAYPLAAGTNPVPGYIIYSANDTITPDYPTYSVNLYNAMKAQGHPAVLDEIVPGIAHLWDPSRNQKIWNFFLANSAPLPQPEPQPEPDPSVVEFEKALSETTENTGSGLVIPVKLDIPSNEKIVVQISVDGAGTALEGSDFVISNKLVTFEAGETLKWAEIEAFSDTLVEGDETAVLSLSVSSGNATLGGTKKHTVTIHDETDIAEFASSSGSFAESVSGVDVLVNLIGKCLDPVTLNVSVDPASTATQGVDFTLNTKTLLFEEVNTKSLKINVVSDSEWESDETVILNLSVVSGPAALGTKTKYTYTILNDDEKPGVIQFAVASGTGVESAGGTDVVIGLDKALNGPVEVLVSVSGSAVEGSDFTIPSKTLQFASGETSKSIDLNVLVDEFIENDETVTLDLNIVSGNVYLGSLTKYTYTIVDDTVPKKIWYPKHFVVFKNQWGVIWNNLTDKIWAMTFDYGSYNKQYSPYGPYPDYTVLDVEVSSVSPYYYWWAMWEKADSTKGLWRRASDQNPARDKLITFDQGGAPKDLAVDKNGNVFVLRDMLNGTFTVTKHTADYVPLKTYTLTQPNSGGFKALAMLVDNWNIVRVLWEKNGSIVVGHFNQSVNRWSFSMAHVLPASYTVLDFDTGVSNTDQATRILLTDTSGNGKVWRINRLNPGNLLSSFDMVAELGFKVSGIETSADGYLCVMLAKDDVSEVWKLNSVKGTVLSKESYSVN